MKMFASLLIAGAMLLPSLSAAEAAPRKLPVLLQANSNIQMVSIRHNHIRALIVVRRIGN